MNLTNILKDKPKGIKLYSTICGECKLLSIDAPNNIKVTNNDFYYIFDEEGKYTLNGECLLFPSKEMRDWNKYLWKKGDILTNGNEYCIFSHFPNDKYNTFVGKFVSNTLSTTKITLITEDWTKVEYQSSIGHYINSIEQKYKGKLNPETLEIEQPKQEFKDGDILTLKDGTIFINKCIDDAEPYCYVSLYKNNLVLDFKPCSGDSGLFKNARFSTDSEKQQLFKMLAKENKAWDAEKKMIIDLPKEHEFKPFDKVLVRDENGELWGIDFFERLRTNTIFSYKCMKNTYKQCIHYEGNEHLVGTTNNPTE